MTSTLIQSPDRLRHLAYLSLIATAIVIAARIATPFDHAIWLIAYLFLVGYLAQDLLWRLEARLTDPSGEGIGSEISELEWPVGAFAQALLWNLGVIAVPVGVFAGARALILLGSIALLIALVSFWRVASAASRAAARPAATGSPSSTGASPATRAKSTLKHPLIAQRALVIFMAVSVLTGLALGWSNPWL